MSVLETLKTGLQGRYQIEREIGMGGMATVYLARDLRHERQVALKVLRPELGAVLGVERFLAEIRVTANLQHPHLLPLFDSGEAAGLLFYVMPYVPGESLRLRLEREHQLAIDDAVRIAIAVASALDYAHRNNVVHRDLKPENILMQDGEPVVSDFGIALAVSNAGGARITQTGLSLGTPAYMSPEQAAGDRVIDARSDVYSLGAVLYEMLIGEAPHTGRNVQQVISRILTEEPRGVIEQRPTVPDYIDEAVHRALAKLPADRYATARDFGEALRGAGAQGTRTVALRRPGTPGAAAPAPRRRWLAALPWVVAVASVATATIVTARRPSRSDVVAPLVRFSIAPPGGLRSDFADLAVAADGRRLLLSDGPPGSRRVWLRTLGEDDIVEVPHLAGTQGLFLSPTGTAVGYVSDGRIRTVPLTGGASTTVASIGPSPFGEAPSWGSAGVIVFTRQDSSGIWAADATGGTPRRVTSPDASGNEFDGSPSFLPDGRRFLFERRRRGPTEPAIMLGSLEGPERALGPAGSTPRYSAGHLIWATTDGTIQVVEVDPQSMAPRGTPVALLNMPAVRGPRRAAFAASHTGVLAFVEASPRRSEVVLVDRAGRATSLVSTPRLYGTPALSPDGRSVAVEVTDAEGASDIWIFDAGGTSRRLTSGGRNQSPAWSPKGDAIAYSAQAAEGPGARLMLQPLDVPGPALELLVNQVMVRPLSFSPSGDSIRFVALDQRAGPRLVSISVQDRSMVPYAPGSGERSASVSPDGRWVLYAGTEDARSEVFVRPSSASSPVTRVSVAGGESPRWSRDGQAIFYRDSSSMIEVALAFTPTVRVTSRQVLFADPFERTGMSSYDVGPGGRMAMLRAEDPANHVDVLANLASLIRARTIAASRTAAGR